MFARLKAWLALREETKFRLSVSYRKDNAFFWYWSPSEASDGGHDRRSHTASLLRMEAAKLIVADGPYFYSELVVLANTLADASITSTEELDNFEKDVFGKKITGGYVDDRRLFWGSVWNYIMDPVCARHLNGFGSESKHYNSHRLNPVDKGTACSHIDRAVAFSAKGLIHFQGYDPESLWTPKRERNQMVGAVLYPAQDIPNMRVTKPLKYWANLPL